MSKKKFPELKTQEIIKFSWNDYAVSVFVAKRIKILINAIKNEQCKRSFHREAIHFSGFREILQRYECQLGIQNMFLSCCFHDSIIENKIFSNSPQTVFIWYVANNRTFMNQKYFQMRKWGSVVRVSLLYFSSLFYFYLILSFKKKHKQINPLILETLKIHWKPIF